MDDNQETFDDLTYQIIGCAIEVQKAQERKAF